MLSDLDVKYLITTSELAEMRNIGAHDEKRCVIMLDQFDFSAIVPPVDFSRPQSLASLSNKFVYDINLFYNRLTDLICNNQSRGLNAPKYVNSGKLKIAGIEMELAYNTPSFHARFNTTVQYALSANQYYYNDHHIYSVPWYMANLTCEQRLLNKGKHSLWLSGNLRNTSRTLNKANSRLKNSKDFYLTGNTLLDLRLKYDYNRMLLFSLDCDNVFDTNYEIGGTSYHPYQYPCRMLMGTISLSL